MLDQLKVHCKSLSDNEPDALKVFERLATYSEWYERRKRGLSPVHASSLGDLYFTYALAQRDDLIGLAKRRLSSNAGDADAIATLALFDLSQDRWNELEERLEKLKTIAPAHKDLAMCINEDHGSYLNEFTEEDIAVLLPPIIHVIGLAPSREGTIFLCSDPTYFYCFTAPLLLSLEKLSQASRVQIHILDAEHLNLSVTMDVLNSLKHVQCGLSVESSGLGDIPQKQKAIYFHAIRYVRLFQAFSRDHGPYCLTDVDGLFVRNPEDAFTALSGHDIGICPVPGMWHSKAHFRAAFTMVTNTEPGANYLRMVAAYIVNAAIKDRLFWGIDQNALFTVYNHLRKNGRAPRVKPLDESIFTMEAKEDSIFWSDGGKEKFELARRIENKDPHLSLDDLDTYSQLYATYFMRAESIFNPQPQNEE